MKAIRVVRLTVRPDGTEEARVAVALTRTRMAALTATEPSGSTVRIRQ